MTSLFTARPGRAAPKGTFEGVPEHLRPQVTRWLDNVYTLNRGFNYTEVDEAALERLAALLRIELYAYGRNPDPAAAWDRAIKRRRCRQASRTR